MTIFLLVNTLFLILSIGYGWVAGDRLDRVAVAWVIAALLGTLAAGFLPLGWTVPAVLVVDLVLLVAITAIALRSRRYWPTWFAGFHLAAVAFGMAALLVAPEEAGRLRALSGFWGVPALLAMVVGLFLDHRAPLPQPQAQPST